MPQYKGLSKIGEDSNSEDYFSYLPQKKFITSEDVGLSDNISNIGETVSSNEFQNPDKPTDNNWQKDAVSGLKSGGISGALTSGGLSAMLGAGSMEAAMAGGGPYALAGGLVLSQIEAAQQAKAAAEQERINNEKTRLSNMSKAYASMANHKYTV